MVNTIPFHSIIPFFSYLFIYLFIDQIVYVPEQMQALLGREGMEVSFKSQIQPLPSRFLQSYWREKNIQSR